MSRTLTLSSIISIVGEEKLRNELNRNTYYFMHIYKGTRNKFYQYNTDANPIEYLIYNNPFFASRITEWIFKDYPKHIKVITKELKLLSEKKLSKYIGVGKNIDYLIVVEELEELEEADEVPLSLADLIWTIISKIDKYDFKKLLIRSDERFDLWAYDENDYLDYDRDTLLLNI